MRDVLCSVLNTDVKRELDHMATFFHMVVQYKAKIGATYQVHTQHWPHTNPSCTLLHRAQSSLSLFITCLSRV
jgi:xylose isomerase